MLYLCLYFLRGCAQIVVFIFDLLIVVFCFVFCQRDVLLFVWTGHVDYTKLGGAEGGGITDEFGEVGWLPFLKYLGRSPTAVGGISLGLTGI
jgi:hypothetical protein